MLVEGPNVPEELKGDPSARFTVLGGGVFQAIGVISFAFVCHHNTLLIYGSLRTPTLDRFNKAQRAIFPLRSDLTWSKVVDYAFLSDFDLLRDSRLEQIPENQQLWSTPAGRLAMDWHFKIERAREEIIRLNVEIRRLWTHMHDEEEYHRAVLHWVEEGCGDYALGAFI